MMKERFWNLMFLCGMFPSLFFLLFIGLFGGMGTIMFLAVILGWIWGISIILVLLGVPLPYVKQEYTELALFLLFPEIFILGSLVPF
ncbi:MAG: hypothetical protein IJ479_02835 [Alphaproteobacteria bacterium]|nr:hypothetical protein [Alphaproteobacteria bacterium]